MPIHTFRFALTTKGPVCAVQLTLDSGESRTAPFEFDLSRTSRINQVVDSISEGHVAYDDLRDVGANLFKGLVNGDVRDLFVKTRTEIERADEAEAADSDSREAARFIFRLEIPPELRYLPWECLYEEESALGFLLNSSKYSLVRETIYTAPSRPARRSLPVRMLVVIPQGSNLNVEKELHSLSVAVAKLGHAIEWSHLQGEVTPDRFRSKMSEGPWDIVHFIGHGNVVDGTTRVRLNPDNPDDGDQWVAGEVFASFFQQRVPHLVTLNCCYGGSEASHRSLSGLGPFLLRAGVPAVVAMQYEIPDNVAIKFAENFYGELLAGGKPGRVDTALSAARLALFQNQTKDRPHSFVTPVLYLASGHDAIIEVAAVQPQASVVKAAVNVPTRKLPEDLLAAFREGRVIPVIGPDILGVGAMRSTPPPPGPRQLAEQLAHEANYPRMEYFRLNDVTIEASGLWLLQAVCQHYERENERWKLLMAVQSIYKQFPPPPVLQEIARWNVPGVICAYFDGFIEEAMNRQHRLFRSLPGIDQKLAGYRDEPLIVHVRGVFNEGDSLVLTERDNELLEDRMRRLSPHVGDLVRKSIGRSLVFLGVSPRDPAIRRLTRALRGSGRNQGPMYFIRSDDENNDAYWNDYPMRWLSLRLEDFVEAVSEVGGTRAS